MSKDMVEVIRCKECKWWDAVKNKGDVGICTPPREDLGGYCVKRGATKANDFCSRAEKGKWEDRWKEKSR